MSVATTEHIILIVDDTPANLEVLFSFLTDCGFKILIVSIEVIGFERLRDEYATCPNFSKIYQALSQGPSSDHSDYTLLDGYLFRENKLCIPKTSLKDFLVWETHTGGLAGHFGKTKTISTIEDQFFWLKLKRQVVQIVAKYWTCAIGKLQK